MDDLRSVVASGVGVTAYAPGREGRREEEPLSPPEAEADADADEAPKPDAAARLRPVEGSRADESDENHPAIDSSDMARGCRVSPLELELPLELPPS